MTGDDNKKIFQNFFSLGLAQGIVSSLQLLVIPFVIAKIGADGFGIVSVAQVVMFYLATVTDFGFNQTAIREIAVARNDNEKISRLFSVVIVTKLLLCLASFLLLVLATYTVPFFKQHSIVYLTGFAFVLGQALQMNWFLQGMERMWFIVITTFIARALFVAAIFIFVKDKNDDFIFLLAMGGGLVVASLICLVIVRRMFKIRFISPARSEIVAELKNGWHFMVTNLSMNSLQYANIFFLRFFTNDLVVGYYSVADRIYFTIRQVVNIFHQGVYPRVCQLVLKGKQEVLLFFRKIYLPFFILVLAGTVLVQLFAPQILFFFAGDEGNHSVFALRMLSLVLVIAAAGIPSGLVILALNHKKNYFRIYTLALLFNLLLNLVLVRYMQVTGTLICVISTELFITTGLIIASTKYSLLSTENETRIV